MKSSQLEGVKNAPMFWRNKLLHVHENTAYPFRSIRIIFVFNVFMKLF